MRDFLDKLASAIGMAEGWFNPDATVLPRRLNNPGDLKFAGQAGATKDTTGFAKFKTPQAGIVALYRQILAHTARGLTLRQMITAWAPPSENDTENYIRETARRAGIDPDVKLWDYLEIERIP